jgi:hypothetical protein
MKRLLCLVWLVACGGDDKAHFSVAPKPPNDQLISGDYERHSPDSHTAIRFEKDGTLKLAHDKAKLDSETLAQGTYKIDGDQLTLIYTEGVCANDGPGVYKIVVSKLGIHFAKVDDACEQRSKIDNEVWHRVK